MLFEPGSTKYGAVFTDIGNKEVDSFMMRSNLHVDKGGLMRDGA